MVSLLLTGAAGYLGRAIAAEAAARGVALRTTSRHDPNHPRDLARDDLGGLLDGVDVVIHAAGRMAGDDAAQARDTIAPTERLRAAAGGRRFVLISSLSVLDYAALPEGATVDETLQRETRPETRDAYTRAKLAQESIVDDTSALILRPGAIYGAGRLWNGHLGVAKGPVLLRIGRAGEVPLIHVASAARAVLDAALSNLTGTLHLVDDALPSRAEYVAMLARGGWPRLTLPLPWPLVRAASRIAGGPGLLTPEILAARMMPLRYSNARARAALSWQPERDHAARVAEAQLAEAAR